MFPQDFMASWTQNFTTILTHLQVSSSEMCYSFSLSTLSAIERHNLPSRKAWREAFNIVVSFAQQSCSFGFVRGSWTNPNWIGTKDGLLLFEPANSSLHCVDTCSVVRARRVCQRGHYWCTIRSTSQSRPRTHRTGRPTHFCTSTLHSSMQLAGEGASCSFECL